MIGGLLLTTGAGVLFATTTGFLLTVLMLTICALFLAFATIFCEAEIFDEKVRACLGGVMSTSGPVPAVRLPSEILPATD